MLVSDEQFLKAYEPIVSTLFGILTLVIEEQPSNAWDPIVCTPFGISTSFKLVQLINE